MSEYLTTKELANLLRIKERKVYDLAASGEIPCAKVTGKLLFPAKEVHAWLAEGRVGPKPASAAPNVFLGSHDPLLDWALRESLCGIATYFDGSLDGLKRFSAGEGVATGLHLHNPEDDSWNVSEVERQCVGMNAVLVGFVTRRRGLIAPPDALPDDVRDLPERRFVPRQSGSGTQPLFMRLLAEAGVDPAAIVMTDPARSETDAALAVVRGEAEVAFGLEALAEEYKLGFTPLVEEQFDLLIDRRAWFETPMQKLLSFCRSNAFATRVGSFKGYDVSRLGTVVWNGP